MNNPLLLFTKNDVPFLSAKMIIHNPSINELGLISESTYRTAIYIILYLAEDLKKNNKIDLTDRSEFDIIMEVINCKEEDKKIYKQSFVEFLNLIFPNYKHHLRKKDIQFISIDDKNGDNELYFLNEDNFSEFKDIISNMFSLKLNRDKYNPDGLRAEKIADKLKSMKKNQNNNETNISIYKKYASVLSVGLGIDLNTVLSYTVNQIENQFTRYILKTKWDYYYNAKIAGASGMEEPDDWMQEV